MLEMILSEVEKLSLAEKRELIDKTKAAVFKELGRDAEDAAAPDRCPRCGSARITKKGLGRHGEQRYLCHACLRTFSSGTKGLLALSKLDASVWARFVEATLSGSSLRRCAASCHVCLRTSWFMRIRLLEVMKSALQPFRTGASVSWQVDGTYLDESLSGNRDRSGTAMPRRPHKHGHAVRTRGISKEKVCVICGANDLGDEFCRVADRGRPRDATLLGAVKDLGPGTWVATDGHPGYRRVLPKLGITEHAATEAALQRDGELGMVDALHQRLKLFLEGFHGVSTKWLDHYLWWFLWQEQQRHSDARDEDTLSGEAARGHYFLTRSKAIKRDQPFWSYWQMKDRH